MSVSSPQSADTQRAFPSHPRVDRYFAAEANEASRRRLVDLLRRGDGPGLLIGAPGFGKTMLLEAIAAALPSPLRVVRLACTQLCTRRALLQAILRGLRLPYGDREEGVLRLSLIDAIETGEGPVALLVDEAQSLPLRLLEELRVLSNVTVDGAPQLRLVLAGTPSLDEALTAPELESFSQRVAARCYLTPLGYEETAQYVRAHLGAAGGDPDSLLAGDVFSAIYTATDGVPRLINQLTDRALVMAVEQGATQIDGADIQVAWSDLNQLPMPWQSPTSKGAVPPLAMDGESSIEFGALDDLDSEDLVASTPTALESETPSSEAMDLPVRNSRPAAEGLWNADQGLFSLGAPSCSEVDDADESTNSQDDCVSLAFPGVASRRLQATNDPIEEPAQEPSPLADDPFDEQFDEEEVVLDRFADLALVTRPGIERVVNRQDLEFGKLFQALEPAVESLVEEVQARDEAQRVGFTVLKPVPPVAKPARVEDDSYELAEIEESLTELEEISSAAVAAPSPGAAPLVAEVVDSSTEEPLLVIEADPEEIPPQVKQAEYRQLFAGLRHG
ncbi:ExeA family protein [Botrimarina hoheduenensis]|uniref:AAA+ ATPase domain-containing protein n=1 Tax=Botrimarina hoheduenensis TaxID=2528000 RepID=A0A5C5WC03_9BACT|nr:AAA family ATPase [Botrimarina hoheduenensis]TWT47693.1 hypothetical protein Pla111_13130 [Botrimarina hoheduenensis]